MVFISSEAIRWLNDQKNIGNRNSNALIIPNNLWLWFQNIKIIRMRKPIKELCSSVANIILTLCPNIGSLSIDHQQTCEEWLIRFNLISKGLEQFRLVFIKYYIMCCACIFNK